MEAAPIYISFGGGGGGGGVCVGCGGGLGLSICAWQLMCLQLARTLDGVASARSWAPGP